MNPEYPRDDSERRLEEAALRALSVYVSLGDKAIELLERGLWDEADATLSRRKAVLHNFRVIDVRAAREGYSPVIASQVGRLGQAAISIDGAIHHALARECDAVRSTMSDLVSRKKIGNYKSGHPDRPVVEQGI